MRPIIVSSPARGPKYQDPALMMCIRVCVWQIRVVNAFQEPSSTPAQLPYKGRPSFAAIVTMTARTAAVAAAVGEPPPTDSRAATTTAATTATTNTTSQITASDMTTPTLVVVEDHPAE